MTLSRVPTAQLSGELSFRNRIINGDMRIDQRNAGASSTVNGNYCTVDRFKAGNNTNTGTIQRITSTLAGFVNSVKYTASGSNTFFQLGQQIEYTNCADLQNQTVTISFRAKANNSSAGSTSLVVRTRTVAGVDGGVIFAGTNVDTNVTLTTSDVAYTVTRTLPSSFGALSIEFTLGSHVSGDGFEITGVQLEAGSVATPFERRPYGTELALCQRYFESVFLSINTYSAQWTGGEFVGVVVPFKTNKRTAPSIPSFTSPVGYWVAAGQQAFSQQTGHSFQAAYTSQFGFSLKSNRPVGNSTPIVAGMYLWESDLIIPASAEL